MFVLCFDGIDNILFRLSYDYDEVIMSSFGASLYRSIASSNSVSNATNFIGEITKHGHNLVSSAITGGATIGNPAPQSTDMNLEAVKIQVTVSIYAFYHHSILSSIDGLLF